MGMLAVTHLTSLDGVMQSPGSTDVPFKYRGWTWTSTSVPRVTDLKYVVTSTLTDPPWNATVLGDDWPEEVTRLRKELDGEIVVYGSRRLSRALIGMGLVDELRLLVYPVVLGAGDRLFGETQDKIAPRPVESRPFGGGVVSMIYAPAMADE
jgi:dihydrofolate reductase